MEKGKSSRSQALLGDHRLITGNTASLTDFTTGEWSRPSLPKCDDLIVVGDRMLLGDSNGGFSLLGVDSFAVLATLEPLARSHGRFSREVHLALSDRHIASYGVTQGILRVTEIGGATVESSDWSGSAGSLSVGAGGRRAAVFREWENGRLECVDLDAATLVELRGPGGADTTTAGITADGEKVVVPTGSILRARTVFVGDFGAAPALKSHAIKSCAHELVNYGDDRYAISTYTLQGGGYVGLHRASSTRAVAKVSHNAEQPWRIAIGHDDDELLVAWQTATVLYDMTKRPKEVASFPQRAAAVALGPRGYLAYLISGELVLRTPLSAELRLPTATDGGQRLAFSRRGDLLFRGTPDGVLEIRRTGDGSVLRELRLHVGDIVALESVDEAIWTMGSDGIVHVLGLPASEPAA